MSELRIGDILRLFFGKTHKHYLVTSLGKDTIGLRDEGGADTLVHEEGRLKTVGKTPITGFYILRDPAVYQDYVIGAFVHVLLHGNKSLKGDILTNEDGVLKIGTTNGRTIYVDLENPHALVRRLSLSETLDDTDSIVLDDLPTDLPELQMITFETLYSKRKAARLRCAMAPRAVPATLPRWVMPVLNAGKYKRNLLRSPAAVEAYVRTLRGATSLPAATTVKGGVTGVTGVTGDLRQCSALLNTLGLRHETIAVVDETVLPGEPLPVDRFAALPALLPLSRAFLPGTPLLDRIRYHSVLDLLFRYWRQQVHSAAKYASFADVLKANPPKMPRADSLYDAVAQLEPYNVLVPTDELLKQGTNIRIPEAEKDKVAPPLDARRIQRHLFSEKYGKFVPTDLFTTEMLSQIMFLDYGQRYIGNPAPSLQALFRVRQGGAWLFERAWQHLKAIPPAADPYERAHVGIVNKLYDSLKGLLLDGRFTETGCAAIADTVAAYAREAVGEESRAWLYHAVTNEPLLPASLERLSSAYRTRGKTGFAAELTSMDLVMMEGSWVDKHTGAVLARQTPVVDTPTSADEAECKPPNFAAEDLKLVRLMTLLCAQLNLRLESRFAFIMNRVRWRMYDLADAACAVAGYLALLGERAPGDVAHALRDLVLKRQDLRIFHAVASRSDLSIEVAKATERALQRQQTTTKQRQQTTKQQQPTKQHPTKQHIDEKDLSAVVRPRPTTKGMPPRTPHGVASIKVPAPVRTEVAFNLSKDETDRRVQKWSEWHKQTAPMSCAEIADLSRNLCIVLPTVLTNQRKHFQNLGITLPADASNAFRIWHEKQVVAPITDMEVGNDQFVAFYSAHSDQFKHINALTQLACQQRDKESARICIVNAVHLFQGDAGDMEAAPVDPYFTSFLEHTFALFAKKQDFKV